MEIIDELPARDAGAPDEIRIDDPALVGAVAVEEEKERDAAEAAEIEKDAATKSQDNMIDKAMEGGALPQNEDTNFTGLAGDAPVESFVRSQEPGQGITQAINSVENARICERLFNEGNVIDMKAELARQQASGNPSTQWVAMISAVIDATENPQFHVMRAAMVTAGDRDLSKYIRQSKAVVLEHPGVPDGVNPDRISWDALSFKTPPSASEFFCQRYPAAVQIFQLDDLLVIEDIQQAVARAIKEKCAEYRQRTQSVGDEFVSDQCLFLEQQIAGAMQNDRQQRIQTMGRGRLIEYVGSMQSIFLTGNLPSSIQPAKIAACHDVISQAELRASIQKIATDQIVQQASELENKHTLGRAYYNSHNTSQFSHAQEASILTRKSVDVFQRRALATLKTDYDRPMRELQNQLAGSSNTLAQGLELIQNKAVVTQNEGQKEISKQQLSVLLACMRIRANAIQKSRWELMTDDDFDHLEIIRFLAHQNDDAALTGDNIFAMATMLLEAYSKGHNLTKFSGKMLPPELGQVISYTIDGRVKIMARKIKLFDDDIAVKGPLFPMLIKSTIMALAQKHRLDNETSDRTTRRLAGTGYNM